MPVFEHRSLIEAPAEEVFAWHSRPGAFERLVPPWEEVRVLERAGGIEEGARLVMRIGRGPFARRWTALHRACEPGRMFQDEQVEGPFRRWVHTHRFHPEGPDSSVLEDRIEYELPLGALGEAVAGGYVRRLLERMYRFRHRRTRHDLHRHARFRDRPRLRIAVSGSTGLVGSALVPFLTAGGHEVRRLVRRRSDTSPGAVFWDPSRGEIEADGLEGVDAVIHLAGKSIAGERWSPEVKAEIRNSRVQSTRLLAETIARLARPPGVLLSASAVGYYGDRGAELLDEGSPPGEGFLAEVCREWEAATAAAEEAGIRVVRVRIGIVLSPRGGSLAKLLPPFRLGLGGPFGSGRQYMSWIALDDLVGILHELLFAEEVRGAVNATAPEPVPNREFARTLGAVLRRPAVLPAPAFVFRLLLGEAADPLLFHSQRVLPRRLLERGFPFLYPELAPALRGELGLDAAP